MLKKKKIRYNNLKKKKLIILFQNKITIKYFLKIITLNKRLNRYYNKMKIIVIINK